MQVQKGDRKIYYRVEDLTVLFSVAINKAVKYLVRLWKILLTQLIKLTWLICIELCTHKLILYETCAKVEPTHLGHKVMLKNPFFWIPDLSKIVYLSLSDIFHSAKHLV